MQMAIYNFAPFQRDYDTNAIRVIGTTIYISIISAVIKLINTAQLWNKNKILKQPQS